ncbi:hypothetical protein Nepgr_032437 [Nepenthes gracilis]|uniref:Disease resistance RPP13-like protein 1 n=1 Tax=Nepenthes gracilis TaxID=150966 RepID=A0AAD3TK02_NEPGR|nr:hypothetical protein Nepgr_032437 [Nepenthes gracilis]
MAASFIGGTFFSAAMKVLLDRAVPRADFFVGLFRRSEPDAALLRAKLSHLMMIIKSMMDDAEENRVTNCAVEEWLNELKNALYDAEDLLDEIADEDRQWQGDSRSRILPPMSPDGKFMAVELEEFSRRVDYLVRQMNVMSSKKHVKGKSAARLPSTDIPDEDRISGREEERRRIIEFLESCEGDRRRISVVAIAGMPGVGKTSLAQHVYNDEILRDFFDIKVWVCVSNDFDVVRVTKTIHESVSSWLFESEDLNIVQKDLSGRLIEKKVLLVLDDLWSEDYDKWDALLKPFKMVAEGSAVLITTRHENVAKVSNPDLTLHLEQLSDEDCWSIIKTHAFSQMDLAVNLKREVLGRKIARKCGGLPLAAKAVGRLLRSTKEDEWELILEHDLWYSVNDKSSILPALQLSYRYLPSHLKRCFSYCSMFPKDYQFEKKKLILLWMAEGFVQHPSDGRSIEEEGDRYFSELLSRSFFQQSSSSVSSFIMHDLFHDLAEMESKEFISRVESGKSCKIPEKVRHFSFRRRHCDDLTKWKPFKSFSHLHTFMPIDYPAVYSSVSLRALGELLPALRRVRVLCLSHYQIHLLPDEIGELQQLRFLDLSFTSLKNLPETICKLHKLETLLLIHCCQLIELPSNFCNLTSLRHLDLADTASLKGMPQGIGSLSSLRTLSKFVVGPSVPSDHNWRREYLTIGVLGSYQHLQGDLCISNMDRVRSMSDATSARLANLKNLEGLKLEWRNRHSDSEVERKVLNLIKPSKTLKRLAIQGYGGTSFPNWIGHCMYSNIVSLHLERCLFCFVLPPLGQLQSLKKLSVQEFIQVTTVGPEFYGCDSSSIIPFRSLETLRFDGMSQWEEWFPIEGDGMGFPCLQELQLTDCPKLLRLLPTHLPSLKKLAISRCPELVTLPPSHRLSPSQTCLEFRSLPATGKLPPQVLLQLTSLKALDLSHCPTMELFPFTRLPRMLETLRVMLLPLPTIFARGIRAYKHPGISHLWML